MKNVPRFLSRCGAFICAVACGKNVGEVAIELPIQSLFRNFRATGTALDHWENLINGLRCRLAGPQGGSKSIIATFSLSICAIFVQSPTVGVLRAKPLSRNSVFVIELFTRDAWTSARPE